MNPIKLSICISSLNSRHATLQRLVQQLQTQARSDEIEILIAADERRHPTGSKRNRLVAAAVGAYVVHIDDDDMVATDYVPKVLAAIDANLGVDVILLRGRRTHAGGAAVVFDYRLGGVEGEVDAHGVLWHNPAHLCPVRVDLAKAVPFEEIWFAEDIRWLEQLKPLLKTAARAGAPNEVLYNYLWEPNKDVYIPMITDPKAPKPVLKIGGVVIIANPAATVDASDHERIFAPQYVERSGPGSTVEFSAPYREFLRNFIRDNKIHSIVDLGCGDMTVMSNVDMNGAQYLGLDVIPERIERNRVKCAPSAPGFAQMTFERRDIHKGPFPAADLFICKDVVQHWSNADIEGWLADLRRAHFRFALVTNCNYGPTVNTDIATGGWRAIDLTKPPFSVGEVVFCWGNKDVVLLRGA